LQWAHDEEDLPGDKLTCELAARAGHLEVLLWASDNGCPFSKEICWESAGGGHLEVLQWAREHGCDWDEGTCAPPPRADTWRC
jgi:hypothetical protein